MRNATKAFYRTYRERQENHQIPPEIAINSPESWSSVKWSADTPEKSILFITKCGYGVIDEPMKDR
jgi:hypothetical protein